MIILLVAFRRLPVKISFLNAAYVLDMLRSRRSILAAFKAVLNRKDFYREYF